MITSITHEVVNGVLSLVQNVVYNNGKQVRRLLDNKTGVPQEILSITNAPK